MGWAMYILDDVFKNWHPVTLNALLHFGGKKNAARVARRLVGVTTLPRF
jgi:hypothetical protein